MSWDLIAQDFADVERVEDIPDDYQPKPLGARDEVIAKIQTILPGADFSDPSWGLITRGGWSIEVSLGDNAICESFSLYVRGGGDEAMQAVGAILAVTGARGIDMQTSQFFNLAASAESFGVWQDYRDQVIETHQSEKSPKPGLFGRMFGC